MKGGSMTPNESIGPPRDAPAKVTVVRRSTMRAVGFFLIALSLVLLNRADAQESSGNTQEAIVNAQGAVLQSLEEEQNTASLRRRRKPLYGNLTSALYRFDASLLGHEYMMAVKKFDEYIGQAVDPVGAQFAAQKTRHPGTREYHSQCFQPPEEDKVLELEKRKKFHDPRDRETLEFLREEHDFFYGPGNNDTLVTRDYKWAWRTAAVYSAQHAGRQKEFRSTVQAELDARSEGYFGAVVSGTFWYPPNAIREWHTNVWDMFVDPETNIPEYPWRMYYVRQKAATPDGGLDTSRTPQTDPDYFADKSGMHLVEGPGIPPERLREFGAYPLNREKHSAEGFNVWRIPDQNGYVSLFRLQHVTPYRWHCIVADDSVHRYSMGMSLNDAGVEAMLRHAGVEL